MDGSRRLSQALSEGDGISLVVVVEDAASARAAEEQGAEAVAVAGGVDGLRESTALPVLCVEGGAEHALEARADAIRVGVAEADEGDALEERAREAAEHGLELVVDVHDDDELQLALDRVDPEIFLLSAHDLDDDEKPLDHVLALLPDVPAGKLAIAGVPVRTRDEVVALERAGFDAVLLSTSDVAHLVGSAPPEV